MFKVSGNLKFGRNTKVSHATSVANAEAKVSAKLKRVNGRIAARTGLRPLESVSGNFTISGTRFVILFIQTSSTTESPYHHQAHIIIKGKKRDPSLSLSLSFFLSSLLFSLKKKINLQFKYTRKILSTNPFDVNALNRAVMIRNLNEYRS